MTDPTRPGRSRLLFTAPAAEGCCFGAPNYAVTSDGERLLMIRRGLGTYQRTEIRIISDFFPELRGRFAR